MRVKLRERDALVCVGNKNENKERTHRAIYLSLLAGFLVFIKKYFKWILQNRPNACDFLYIYSKEIALITPFFPFHLAYILISFQRLPSVLSYTESKLRERERGEVSQLDIFRGIVGSPIVLRL